MRALVTGACGFVGRHMCKKLTSLGYEVLGIDNLISESSLPLEVWPAHLKCEIDFIQGDTRKYFIENSSVKFDLVIHLAAVVGGRSMIEDAPLAVAEDLAIDAMFFNWCTKAKPTKIVYFSSSAAYPIKFQRFEEHTVLKESMIDLNGFDISMPDLTYGWTKLTGEFLAKLAHEKYDLDISCFRPFSGYGEDQNPAYPFPAILRRVMRKENPVEIWADTVRDFIHIDDCIDGMLTIMQKTHAGEAINLGTGIGISFSELGRKMAKLNDYETEIKILNNKPQGVYYRVADITMQKSYGFEYKITLDQGILKANEFFKK